MATMKCMFFFFVIYLFYPKDFFYHVIIWLARYSWREIAKKISSFELCNTSCVLAVLATFFVYKFKLRRYEKHSRRDRRLAHRYLLAVYLTAGWWSEVQTTKSGVPGTNPTSD
jgi:hypothetical protein